MKKRFTSKRECGAAYYQQNRALIDARRKRYMIEHPGYRRNLHLVQNYGITLADYEVMLIEQKGRCKICPRLSTETKRGLVVDHDHVTGKIRGLLCDRCNLTLGLYEANRQNFDRYLEGYRHD